MAHPSRLPPSRPTSSRAEAFPSSSRSPLAPPPVGISVTEIDICPNDQSHPSYREEYQISENEETIMSSQEYLCPEIRPFFTMIEDLTTGSHYHPDVHYIFSDDDSDATIEAMQRIGKLRTVREAKTHHRRGSRTASHSGPGSITQTATTPEERYVVVELSADGTNVASAHSLSADWQVLEAAISQAPELDPGGTVDNHDEKDKTLMLRIDGISEVGGSQKHATPAGDDAGQAIPIDDEIRGFNMRMAELAKVVNRAERDFLSFGVEMQASEGKV
ncbi:MAG: hypothetical protein GOMPHAMPRED_005272 [Gomphillus americanus]|uniref:Uncharacterized protein n=1 Tax=Gomphillus americanus TaxID=1940652 RepID=A0A8H3IPV7_9LECA|nr:MAG: hypothetical protein GOMPHAMPRED_005272 [Gomphillus americanus]